MNGYLLWTVLFFLLVGIGLVFGRNAAGYLFLKTTKRLNMGDWIRLGAFQGKVNKVGWQVISLRDEEGQEVYIPNATVFNNALTIIPPLKKDSDIELSVPLPEGCDPARGRQAVWQAAALSPYLGVERLIEVTLVQRADRSTWIQLVAQVADERFSGAFETAIIEGVRDQIGVKVPTSN
jgi:hypothetical protein